MPASSDNPFLGRTCFIENLCTYVKCKHVYGKWLRNIQAVIYQLATIIHFTNNPIPLSYITIITLQPTNYISIKPSAILNHIQSSINECFASSPSHISIAGLCIPTVTYPLMLLSISQSASKPFSAISHKTFATTHLPSTYLPTYRPIIYMLVCIYPSLPSHISSHLSMHASQRSRIPTAAIHYSICQFYPTHHLPIPIFLSIHLSYIPFYL